MNSAIVGRSGEKSAPAAIKNIPSSATSYGVSEQTIPLIDSSNQVSNKAMNSGGDGNTYIEDEISRNTLVSQERSRTSPNVYTSFTRTSKNIENPTSGKPSKFWQISLPMTALIRYIFKFRS